MKPRHILLLLSALCLSAACGQTAQPPEGSPYGDAEVHSGSRLRARWLEAEDARQFLGWYDTELDMPCNFVELKAGYRCIPSQVYIGYLDAACTQRVAFGVARPGIHSVENYGSDACDSTREVELVRVGEGAPNPGALYAEPGCSSVVVADADVQVYPITGQVAVSSTVSARQAIEPLDARINSTLLVTTDGAQAFLDLYDRQLKSRVYAKRDLLVPAATEIFNGYADPACVEPLRPVSTATCPSEYGKLEPTADEGCDGASKYFHMTTQKADVAYGNIWGVCSNLSERYEVGEEVNSSELLSVSTEVTGSGRIRALAAHSTDSGASLGSSGWLDSRWGSECVVSSLREQGYRCIPYHSPSTVEVNYNRFRDSSCSLPLTTPSECGTEIHFAWAPLTDTIYEVQGVEQLAEAYSVVNGVCTSEPQGDFFSYVLSPLTPEDFVEFREVIE